MKKNGFFKRSLKYIIKGVQPIYVNVYNTCRNEALKDRIIFITGGSKGLGYAIAKRSIEEGARVIICGRNENDLKNAVSKLGKNCAYIKLDVCNIDEIKNVFKKAEAIFNKKIDSLVSNAGISLHEGDFHNVTPNSWDEQFNVNLKGNYFIVKEFIEYLENNENDTSGNILVITSERAKRDDDIPYGLTKIATSSFIKTMASRVIDKGIRVNGVGPGVTASNMTGFNEEDDLYCPYQPTKRVFVPEEIAEVCNFILSDVSNCISGEIITCNQGRHISHW